MDARGIMPKNVQHLSSSPFFAFLVSIMCRKALRKTSKRTAIHELHSGSIFRMDLGLNVEIALRALLNSLYSVHVHWAYQNC